MTLSDKVVFVEALGTICQMHCSPEPPLLKLDALSSLRKRLHVTRTFEEAIATILESTHSRHRLASTTLSDYILKVKTTIPNVPPGEN